MVVTAETTPNHSLPKTMDDCCPTPAAPMVCAIVFKESMEAMALELSLLYFLNNVAAL